MSKKENIASTNDFANYKSKILNRLQRELTQKKISQKKLGEICGLSQPSISKLLKGNSPLTLEFLYNVCSALDINIDMLLSEEATLVDKMSIMTPSQNIMQDNLNSIADAIVFDPSLYPFRGYLGTYFFYCNSTISSERRILKGNLSLTNATQNGKNFCQCKLELYTGTLNHEGENNTKIYTGTMLISLPMQSCYCILSCEESAEYVFLLFHHMFLIKADLECRIAAVLTTSAGSHRRPTMEKAIISRTKLSTNSLKEIEGQLKINSSNIKIKKSDFDKYILKDLPKEFPIPDPEEIYMIEESSLKIPSISAKQQLELTNKLRKYSLERYYTKVSSHADDILYNFIINKKHRNTKIKKRAENE